MLKCSGPNVSVFLLFLILLTFLFSFSTFYFFAAVLFHCTLSEQRYTRSVKNQFHPLLRYFHSVYVQYTSIKRLAGIEIAFFPTLRL